MASITTIQINEETKSMLDNIKNYPRETYEDVIKKLLTIVAEENMELSEETKKEIEVARAEIKQGKYKTLEQVKKELKL